MAFATKLAKLQHLMAKYYGWEETEQHNINLLVTNTLYREEKKVDEVIAELEEMVQQ